MKKNCIIYLVRTSEKDLEMLNKSLQLVDENVLTSSENVDVILFHEIGFNDYKSQVHQIKNANIIFQNIVFPEPPEGTPDMFPHPNPDQVAMGNLGFSIGYRHMCWFFSGGMYDQSILQDYKYYLRLDTDSFILSPINYDIFKMMSDGGYRYGFIEEAIQKDDPAVIEGLWDFAGGTVSGIDEGLMYYTNFEIGEIEWFRNGLYHMFFKRIEWNGGIYIKRWGDAPIKYLGVTLFMPPQWKIPVKGFTYQHGAVYDLTNK